MLKCNVSHLSIPILSWFPNYTKSELQSDLMASLVVLILLIPQGMAYGALAGLRPQYGLYCATIPLIVYGIFGSSKQLSVAAYAIISLLTASTLQGVGLIPGTVDYTLAASTLAFLSGIMSTVMAVMNLGILTHFLSNTVITGFITASAIIISINQIKYLLGIHVPNTLTYTVEKVWYILVHMNEINPSAVFISVIAFLILYVSARWKEEAKKWTSKQKRQDSLYKYKYNIATSSGLIAILVTSFLSYILLASSEAVVPIIGKVPRGLPFPTFPILSNIGTLFSGAFTISIVSFMSNYAISEKYARLHGYEVDASQELFACGLCNIFGSLFHAFPVAGKNNLICNCPYALYIIYI